MYVEGYNRHHTWSPKFKYRYPIAKELREHPYCINRVQIDPHARWHAENAHPLLLSREQMLGCLNMMQELDVSLPPHERIAELATYLSTRSDRESRVADNLFRQADFIQEYGI